MFSIKMQSGKKKIVHALHSKDCYVYKYYYYPSRIFPLDMDLTLMLSGVTDHCISDL